MRFIVSCIFLIVLSGTIHSQPFIPPAGKIYDDHIIPRIDIFLDDDSLDAMYNDLYTEHEYPVTFIWNDGSSIDTIENTGMRIRGNTSQVSQKKSWKIDFNHFEPGRKFHGFEKLHLNGEHNDPSIIRSKLYWETLESMKTPGPRANHTDLYINGSYHGIYINVEVIDENFVMTRFGNRDGNLYKCLWPADLGYISSDPDDYKFEMNDRRAYELQTNTQADDYSDLAAFISMLEFTPDPDFPKVLEENFNVNSFLRTYAVDVVTGNWDSYTYNQNNYYLYHNTETNKFEFISYDTDNTYGIDWFGEDWGTKNSYNWYNDNLDVVLIQRILEVDEYVERFTFFMEQLENGMANPTVIFPKIDSILTMIKPSAQADQYRTYDYGWDYDDFLDSYTQDLGGHVTYGLKPFISTRYDETASQLQNTNVIPVISNAVHLPKTLHASDDIHFTAWVEDESDPTSVLLNYKINSGIITGASMMDDGLHEDGVANDDVYGFILSPAAIGDTVSYFITGTDLSGQTGREPREGYYYLVITPVPHLYINEIMASNVASISDEYGEFDDWIEIYNADSFPVFLGDKFLSDEPGNPDKWRLPDVQIPGYGFVMIWCDGESFQGDFHCDFKLNVTGEELMLYEGTGLKFNLLDSVTWANLPSDLTIGYSPDGVAPIIPLEAPTPGYSNLSIGIGNEVISPSIKIYPNPFDENLTAEVELSEAATIESELFNILGEKISSASIIQLQPGKYVLPVAPVEDLAAGMYLVRISATGIEDEFVFTQKVLKD